MAEKKEKETPVKEPEKKVDVNAFVARKLKDINEIENEALAKFLAERVLNNKRGKK